MPRHSTVLHDDYDDDDDEDDDQHDDPLDSDMDSSDDDTFGDSATEECPHCHAEISEFAQQCPECGQYISEEDGPPRTGHPTWVIVTAIALLIPMIYALLRWFL